MNPDEKKRLASFDTNLTPFIMWPVTVFMAQEDGPEIETTLECFRFYRPQREAAKKVFEARLAREKRATEFAKQKGARLLRNLDDDTIDKGVTTFDPEIIALAKDRDRVILSDEEMAAELDRIWNADAERDQWWFGWKTDSIRDHDNNVLNYQNEEERAEYKRYLLGRVFGLQEAIDRAIAEMLAGGRQKNSKA